jgi:hypothetical protein
VAVMRLELRPAAGSSLIRFVAGMRLKLRPAASTNLIGLGSQTVTGMRIGLRSAIGSVAAGWGAVRSNAIGSVVVRTVVAVVVAVVAVAVLAVLAVVVVVVVVVRTVAISVVARLRRSGHVRRPQLLWPGAGDSRRVCPGGVGLPCVFPGLVAADVPVGVGTCVGASDVVGVGSGGALCRRAPPGVVARSPGRWSVLPAAGCAAS